MVDAQSISIIFAGISIGLAAIYYAMNIKNQRDTRQAQLFMSIYSRWHELGFTEVDVEVSSYEITNWDESLERYGAEGYAKVLVMARYYEGLGVLVHRNLIDVNMVDDLLSESVLKFYRKYEPVILERRRRDSPQFGEWTEYLYNRIKTIVEQQHPELIT